MQGILLWEPFGWFGVQQCSYVSVVAGRQKWRNDEIIIAMNLSIVCVCARVRVCVRVSVVWDVSRALFHSRGKKHRRMALRCYSMRCDVMQCGPKHTIRVPLLPIALVQKLFYVGGSDVHRVVVLEEFLPGHPEQTVVVTEYGFQFLPDLGMFFPTGSLVAKLALGRFSVSPGVSDLDHVDAGAGHVDSAIHDGVGVVVDDTVGRVLVGGSLGRRSDQIIRSVPLAYFPEQHFFAQSLLAALAFPADAGPRYLPHALLSVRGRISVLYPFFLFRVVPCETNPFARLWL
mmetsp:Transcript_29034/g.78566  ORF Transcript_29034/g.78566 Transcript_29034/m.78566 type:complete len:288 (-) Transcript_29034:1458-2321(-)